MAQDTIRVPTVLRKQAPVVAARARRLGVSERTLHRDVVATTAVSQQMPARVRRFQAGVGLF